MLFCILHEQILLYQQKLTFYWIRNYKMVLMLIYQTDSLELIFKTMKILSDDDLADSTILWMFDGMISTLLKYIVLFCIFS